MRTHLAVTSGKPARRGQNDGHSRWEKGPEAAGEEQPDKLRKTVRFEQEAPSAAASSDPTVALEYPASGETEDRPGSELVQKSGHVDEDVQNSALDPFYEMEGRKSRSIGEVLEWYRAEDSGDLKRSETCLSALQVKFWKCDQKVVMNDKINPKIGWMKNGFRPA